jgi:hypothetical protein
MANVGEPPSINLNPTWLSFPVEDLTEQLEHLPCTDIHACICQCNALVDCICRWAIYLQACPPALLCDIFLTYFPFPTSSNFTCDQVFSATLEQEFESHLIHCLSLAITSFSAQCKLTRAETKQSELNAAHAQ